MNKETYEEVVNECIEVCKSYRLRCNELVTVDQRGKNVAYNTVVASNNFILFSLALKNDLDEYCEIVIDDNGIMISEYKTLYGRHEITRIVIC